MKLNRSPSGAPSAERSATASANVAFGDIACFARVPPQLAGDSRKTRFDVTRNQETARAIRQVPRTSRSQYTTTQRNEGNERGPRRGCRRQTASRPRDAGAPRPHGARAAPCSSSSISRTRRRRRRRAGPHRRGDRRRRSSPCAAERCAARAGDAPATMIAHESSAVSRSPAHGTSPMIGSQPNADTWSPARETPRRETTAACEARRVALPRFRT